MFWELSGVWPAVRAESNKILALATGRLVPLKADLPGQWWHNDKVRVQRTLSALNSWARSLGLPKLLCREADGRMWGRAEWVKGSFKTSLHSLLIGT